jgi:DNA modification methylase
MAYDDEITAAVIPIDSVRFVKELYPRLREDDATIERYRDAVDQLPPIVVARGGILVDGFHRLQAHKREGRTEIAAEDLGDLTDTEIFNESIRRNASHGHQLSRKDKQNLAGKLWQTLAHLPNAERTAEIAKTLAVSDRAVQGWTKDARKFEKEQQQAQAWDAWLDCKTEHEIADGIGSPRTTIQSWLDEKRKSAEFVNAPESRQHFDVWNFQNAADDAGTDSYFGKMPPQVVENLLWLYTQPGQTVFDPFAGGGTTIDVAKRMGRRVWASDRKPSTPTLPIHEHDITTGWPESAPRKVDFVLLDPPYWQQAKGRYSDDPEDLGNVELDEFNASWSRVVKACAERLADGGLLAYIISPTQLDDGSVVDHAFDMYQVCRDSGLTPHRRIIVPYSTQQATGQQVTWARENKRMCKLYRDLVVLRP